MKKILVFILAVAASLPANGTPNSQHQKSSHPVTDSARKYERLMAAFAKLDVIENKREARLNGRIVEHRRKLIYYQISGAITQNILDRSPHSDNPYVVSVCRKYHISAYDADTIRMEGDKQNWPQPSL